MDIQMLSDALLDTGTLITNSWQYTSAVPISSYNQCSLDLIFSKSAATYLYIIVQFSHDKSTWFTDQLQNVGASFVDYIDLQRRFAEDGNKSVQFPISHLYMRVGYKVDAAGTGATLGVRVTLNERVY